MYSPLVTKLSLVGCGLLQKETSRSERAFWAGGGMDVGLSDCQPPKRIPVQGVRSVEPPPASSTALALWCLPLVIGTNCVSIQMSLLLPLSRIRFFLIGSIWKSIRNMYFMLHVFAWLVMLSAKHLFCLWTHPFAFPLPASLLHSLFNLCSGTGSWNLLLVHLPVLFHWLSSGPTG